MATTNPKRPLDWQRDPLHLKTERVQYWKNGVMVTAMMPLEKAREAVAAGTAFVISGHAIGALNERGEYAA